MLVNTTKTIEKINGYFKGSVLNVIKIGTELNNIEAEFNEYLTFSNLKKLPGEGITSAESKKRDDVILEKAEMYKKLGFGQKVGQKFIAISKDKYIGKYAANCPASYNTLYDLLRGKSEAQFKKLVEAGLNPTKTRKEVEALLSEISGDYDYGKYPTTRAYFPKSAPTSEGDAKAESSDNTSKDVKSEGGVSEGDAKAESSAGDNNAKGNGTLEPTEPTSYDYGEVLFGKSVEVLSISVDEASVTSEEIRSELFSLQDTVAKMITAKLSKIVTVKKGDVPVAKVTVKVPASSVELSKAA